MKIQLVLFAVASAVFGYGSALGDGLNLLNAKNMYDHISSQVRIPLISETSGVRSVIESMKDLQQRLREEQLRNYGGILDTRTTKKSQLHHQPIQSQDRFSPNTAVPQNRRSEFIQINEHIVPSHQYKEQTTTIALTPAFLNENQFAINQHNSYDGRRQSLNQQQIYQDRQLERFNQQHSYDGRQQSLFPQTSYNNKQQESNNEQSVYGSNQEVFNAQFFNNKQQPIFPQRSYDRQQETIAQRSFKQESLRPQQPYDARQQAASARKSFNDNQEAIPQRSNNNQASINQQRQFHNEGKTSTSQLANNDQPQVAVPQQFPENQQQVLPQQQINRNMEINKNKDQDSFSVSNQQSQIFRTNTHPTNEEKSTEGQPRYGFETTDRSTLIPEDTTTEQYDQNEDSKYLPLVSTIIQTTGPVFKESDSGVKGGASIRHHLKTPYIGYNYSHFL